MREIHNWRLRWTGNDFLNLNASYLTNLATSSFFASHPSQESTVRHWTNLQYDSQRLRELVKRGETNSLVQGPMQLFYV